MAYEWHQFMNARVIIDPIIFRIHEFCLSSLEAKLSLSNPHPFALNVILRKVVQK
jgi:hypothetical protein